MLFFYLSIPLMVLGVAVATLPLVVGMHHEHRPAPQARDVATTRQFASSDAARGNEPVERVTRDVPVAA